MAPDRDERGARASAGRIFPGPDDLAVEIALGADHDDGVGHLGDARDGNVEQAATIRIAQRELVRAEATGLAARDDDRG